MAEVDTSSRRWTGGWGLYRDGQASPDHWCEATEEGVRSGESSVAECTVTLASDASYVLEIANTGTAGRFRYSFEGH